MTRMDENLPVVGEIQLWEEQNVFGGSRLKRMPQRRFDREQQAKDIVEVFHMIGGVPRLAHWANDHPGYFFTKLLPKVLPQASTLVNQGSMNVVFQQAIPPSPLDDAPPLDVPFTET